MESGRSLNRGRWVILLFALVLGPVLGGCVVVPTTSEGGFDKPEALITTLIGADTSDVRAQLGEPNETFELSDVTYLIYRKDADQRWVSLAHPIAIIWYQLPVQWGSATLIQCLLIESRNGKVATAKLESVSDLTGAALHMKPQYQSCRSVLWTDEELAQVEAAARDYRRTTLAAQARHGNAEVASRGNPDAARALQSIDCKQVYYRASDSENEQPSDRYVGVCEGDKFSTEETVKVYADWGDVEGNRYRTYFKSTPESLRVGSPELKSPGQL